jgi:hypothetical protein
MQANGLGALFAVPIAATLFAGLISLKILQGENGGKPAQGSEAEDTKH